MRQAIRAQAFALTFVLASWSPLVALAQHEDGAEATVESLAVHGTGSRADLTIRGDFAIPTYEIRSRDEGRIVVIEVSNASMPDAGLALDGDSSLVTRSTTSATAMGVRIELELSAPVAYRARASAGRIQLRLERIDEDDSLDDDEVPVVGAARDRGGDEDEGTPTIQGVSLERRDGRDRVVVTLNHASPFNLVPGLVGNARLEVPLAAIGAGCDRDVDITGSGHVVRGIRVHMADGRAVIEVERPDGSISDTSGIFVRE